jgi:hypothetical protein
LGNAVFVRCRRPSEQVGCSGPRPAESRSRERNRDPNDRCWPTSLRREESPSARRLRLEYRKPNHAMLLGSDGPTSLAVLRTRRNTEPCPVCRAQPDCYVQPRWSTDSHVKCVVLGRRGHYPVMR